MPPRFATTYNLLKKPQLLDALSAFSIPAPPDPTVANLKKAVKAHMDAHPEYMDDADFVELYSKTARAEHDARAGAPPTPRTAQDHIEVLRQSLKKSTPYTSGVLAVKAQELKVYYDSTTGEKDARGITFGNASDEELVDLAAACQPATFGRNTEDVYDESYRKAGKMDNSTFASTLNFATLQDVVESITPDLLEGHEGAEDKIIRAELYKLNVYGPGSFFKEHKDTPRSQAMIGSLVIVFPTQHQGGALTLAHGTQSWKFDSASKLANNPSSIAYVAFFSDVTHAVEEVKAGYRVTITYNLFLAERPAAGLAPSRLPSPAERECEGALRALLADETFLPAGGLLGFGLTHQYPIPRTPADPAPIERVVRVLKGSDARMHSAAVRAGLETTVRFFYHYSMWDGANGRNYNREVLLDEVAALGGGHGHEEIGPGDTYRQWEREGERVRRIHSDSFGAEADSEAAGKKTPEKETAIYWVTKLLRLNKAQSAYVAMGNEADLAHEYGYAALFIRVPPAGKR
ncbi:Fe2OG dioxygenase domain-containing protein [Mycena kentingensis (nom. inval.)]|nr:Fe2OG dioxygenase domain-containing protein [Mycena kentingensis (nom. inval.)]